MTIRALAMAALLLVVCPLVAAPAAADATRASVARAPVDYPASAVAAGEEGTVLIALEVDASGRARDVSVQESSGYPRLDDAALHSVTRWSFRPATREGRPRSQRILVPVAFRLNREANFVAEPHGVAAIAGALLCLLGGVVWTAGAVWSVVQAKRSSLLWLWCMVALWIVAYPVFLAMHWTRAKRSLAVVLLGVFLFSLGIYLEPSR